MTQELFCNACQAIVQETLKRVRESKKESDIITALDGLCNMKNFYIYEYPPPEIKKGCDAFYTVPHNFFYLIIMLKAYYDILERELIKRIDNDSIQERICNKVTKVCEGVDFEAKKQQTLQRQKEERERGFNQKFIFYQDDKRREELKKKEQEEEQYQKQEKLEQEIEQEINLDEKQEDL